MKGFRANKVEGNTVFALEQISAIKGDAVFRNHDRIFTENLSKDSSASRKIAVDFECWKTDDGIAVKTTGENGIYAITGIHIPHTPASSSQEETRRKVFGKLGDTDFRLRDLVSGDTLGLFIPASTLAEIRRKAVDSFKRAIRIRHQFEYRKCENRSAPYITGKVSFAENISNKLSETFYNEHGVTDMERALETAVSTPDGTVVMTTRYCIRRELGCCLRTLQSRKLPKNLLLESGNIRMSVEFDCKNCQMALRKQ